ncbi:MAG: hypothetical protein JW841_11040 [Deltaproteobacteria bacterium]|nr:hypothetical protein [Deltaproteobacteria bacterium]
MSALVVAVLLLSWHLLMPSSFHDGYWFWRIDYIKRLENITATVALHELNAPFIQRPFMTFIIKSLEHSFSIWYAYVIAVGLSFFVASFCLLLACKHLNNNYDNENISSWWHLACFALSYTILFAYFVPIYTYDDLWQYAFLLLAVSSYRNTPLRCALWLCIAVIARETTVLTLPSFAIAILLQDERLNRKNFYGAVIAVIIPALFFIGLKYFLPYPDMKGRDKHYLLNFANAASTFESFTSMVWTLGPFIVLGILVWMANRKIIRSQRNLIIAALITLIINTPIVLIATKAREARLFALPLVFIWPIAGAWLKVAAKCVHDNFMRLQKKQRITIIGIGVLIAIAVALLLGAALRGMLGYHDGFRIYAALFFGTSFVAYRLLRMPTADSIKTNKMN